MTSNYVPESIAVEVNGETITVSPLNFGAIPKFLKVATNIFSIISADADADGNLNVIDLISNGGEDVVNAVAIAINKPRSYMDTIPADAGLDLAFAVFSVNKNLFEKKVLPMIQTALATLPQA